MIKSKEEALFALERSLVLKSAIPQVSVLAQVLEWILAVLPDWIKRQDEITVDDIADAMHEKRLQQALVVDHDRRLLELERKVNAISEITTVWQEN